MSDLTTRTDFAGAAYVDMEYHRLRIRISRRLRYPRPPRGTYGQGVTLDLPGYVHPGDEFCVTAEIWNDARAFIRCPHGIFHAN